jgi:hypothetical protein
MLIQLWATWGAHSRRAIPLLTCIGTHAYTQTYSTVLRTYVFATILLTKFCSRRKYRVCSTIICCSENRVRCHFRNPSTCRIHADRPQSFPGLAVLLIKHDQLQLTHIYEIGCFVRVGSSISVLIRPLPRHLRAPTPPDTVLGQFLFEWKDR